MLFDVLAAHLSFDGETRGNLCCYGPSSVSFYLYLFLFSHFKIRLLYMKNVMLRATRTFIEDFCAPEYAHNHLAVEISHPDGFTDAQELSIRVYSSEYRLLGCDTRSLKGKRPRKVRFDILSEEEWETGLYRIYVYRNGRPMGWTLLELYSGYECWDKTEVEDFQTRPEEKYFAETFCFLPLFSWMHQEQCDSNLIRQFLETLYALDSHQLAVPHLFVSGNQARKYATRLLALHFCEKQTALCSHFSLQELLEGSLQWKVLQEKMDTRKVVLVEVPYKEYSRQESNLIDLLGNLMEQKASSGPIFIFYGTMDSTYQLRRCSTAMSRIFTEENTIYTPDKTETDAPSEAFPVDDLPLPFDEEQPLPHTEEDSPLPEDNTPSDAEQALQEMVGLTRLKEDLQEARMMAAFMKRRMELGLDTELDNRHHMLFLGNPGTGKTTVAKLIGQLYHQMGLLSSGHTIETCRTKLVGEYIGETEKHIRQAIEEARGGVLFIDEAYTLITTKQETKDFGKEVIHALLTVLSEPNPDMIIILAGYEDKMQQMLRTNPGLQERFPLQFYFDDYNADELMEMAHRLLQKRNFQLTSEADKELYTLITEATTQRDEYFGNGRWLHNLIEQGIIKCMAQRIMSQPSIPDNTFLFRTITQEDVVKAGNRLRGKQVVKLEPQPIRRIGFRA